LPLSLVAFSLFKPQHGDYDQEMVAKPEIHSQSLETNDPKQEEKIVNSEKTERTINEQDQNEHINTKKDQDEVTYQLLEQEIPKQPSWYERIKTAAISSTSKLESREKCMLINLFDAGTTGIANATAKIKYAFISKDTYVSECAGVRGYLFIHTFCREEAFLQIWELMNVLLKDVPFNKLDLLFGLMMLQGMLTTF
jgi:hypothetical protein